MVNQYAVIELSKDEVIKIIKNNLVQDENAQNLTEYEVLFLYNDYKKQLITTIVKSTKIGEYIGSIREDIDEITMISLLKKSIKDENYCYNAYKVLYDISDDDTNKKEFKGVYIKLYILDENEKSFILQ